MTTVLSIVASVELFGTAAWWRLGRRRAAVSLPVRREPEMFWWPTAPACSFDAARDVLVHVAPAYQEDEAEVLEFPVARGWDHDAILTTLAEIEAL